MSPFVQHIRDTLAPLWVRVAPHEIPTVQRHVGRMARLAGMMGVICAPGIVAMGVLSGAYVGDHVVGWSLAAVAIAAVGALATHVVIGRGLGDEALLLVIAVNLGVLTAIANASGLYAVCAAHAPFIMVAGLAFLPVPPRLVISALLLTLVQQVGVLWVWAPEALHVLATLLPATFAASAGALLTGQLRRLRWRSCEQMREKRIATEGLAEIGRMSASLADDLEPPLAAKRSHLVALRALADELEASAGAKGVTNDDLREIVAEATEALAAADRAAERIGTHIRQLREHARARQDPPQPVALEERLEGLLRRLQAPARRSGATLTLSAPADATVTVAPAAFDQVVVNLVENAVRAIEESGRAGEVRVTVDRAAGTWRLVVEDDGDGVPEALRETLFEQGVSSRREDGATGLGLWMARSLAASSGGVLTLERRADRAPGARFAWRLGEKGATDAPAEAWRPAFAPAA